MTRKEAAKAGITFFYTKSCKQCGDERRYTSNAACVTCLRKRVKKYHEDIGLTLRGAKNKKKEVKNG